MNHYKYEEMVVGQAETFEQKITADMMDDFKHVSGDTNPLHYMEDYAREKGFAGRVVYGMLVASLYSRLVGVYLPGEHCLLQSVQSDFCRPVYVGDCLTVNGSIVEKTDSVRQVIIKATVKNQFGKVVSRAKIEAGVL